MSEEKSEQRKTETIENEEELMKRLIVMGINGNMEEINEIGKCEVTNLLHFSVNFG